MELWFWFSSWLFGKGQLYALIAGALGGATPYVLIALFGGRVLKVDESGAADFLMGLPSIFIGMVIGGLSGWYIEEVSESAKPSRKFLVGYIGGLIPWMLLAIHIYSQLVKSRGGLMFFVPLIALFFLIVIVTQVHSKRQPKDITGNVAAMDTGQYEQPAVKSDSPNSYSESSLAQPKAYSEKRVDPMLLSGPKDRKSPFTLIWLILSQLLSVLLLILWFLTLIAAQGAEEPWELLLAFSLLLHPVTATICSIVAWILYAKVRYKLAAIVTSIPLLPFAILFSSWIYYELVKHL
jgi:hypothetical protein